MSTTCIVNLDEYGEFDLIVGYGRQANEKWVSSTIQIAGVRGLTKIFGI